MAFNGMALQHSGTPHFRLVNLSHAQQWADAFVEASHAHSTVQKHLHYPQWCVVRPLREICNDIFSVYKVAAIWDALERFPCDDVLWLDTDAYVAKPIDSIIADRR